ncbi:MAG TPA: DUF2332 domain-containing protein [Rhizomicrobium sp.]|nr:DUF2332 domain-containing protein [Rhizomicrobium sp.]
MYADETRYWTDFAEDARRMGSPLYAGLAEAIHGDEVLKAIAARRRKGQPPANLLLAAVHYLLLRGTEHRLREYYRSLGGTAYRPNDGAGPELFSVFRDFVMQHQQEVQRLVETRVTNTNEVGRSAMLRAGFGALAGMGPLHLIEIGPSAGLNMIWDRYGIRYMREGVTAAEVMPGAPLVLSCDLRSNAVPPVGYCPHIAGRIGLELNPVDLKNSNDRDWLRALVWPDQPHRLERLEAAIQMFLETPAEIRAGDALVLLPEALAEIPPDEAVCVYHTITTYQFSAEMRTALEALLVTVGLSRPVWHLSFEFDGGSDYAVTLTHHRAGVANARTLGLAQPHGGWIAWAG